MKAWRLAAAFLLPLCSASAARAFEVESLRQAGPIGDRFNIAILGDGYRTADQAKLKTDAEGVVDYLFGVAPLAHYAAFFNVKLVHVVSSEQGADNGTYGDMRDTALGAYYDCDGIDRLLCVDDAQVAVAAVNDVPEFNFAIVIVNDQKYGGSGGPIGVASSNQDSFEVLAHEVGHSLANLADEYSDDGNQPPCNALTDCDEANATLRTSLAQLKWQDWIEAGTPLPTPATPGNASVVGLFEGARYMPTGIYRPQLRCKMRDLDAGYCAVCSEQFVRSIWTMANIKMIEATTPAARNLDNSACEPLEFSVESPPITPSTYRYTWIVDGKQQPETTSRIELLPGVLGQGSHDVEVAVQDATAMVRNNPDNALRNRFSWTLSQTQGDCPVPAGGGGAAGSAGGGGGGGSVVAGAGGDVDGAGDAPSGGGGRASAGTSTGGAGVVNMAGNVSSSGFGPNPPPRETSGCGCSLPGQSSTGPLWPLAMLAGVLRLSAASKRFRSAHGRR